VARRSWVVLLSSNYLRCDDAGVWLGDFGFLDLAAFAYADLVNEDLIEHSAAEIACGEVGLKRLLGEHERIVEGGVDIGELDLRPSEQLVEALLLRFDALSLATHDAFGYAAFEVEFEKLCLLVF
jgi:hypothetical protein